MAMNKDTRIAILGASGRMGRALIEGILDTPELTLSAALTRDDDPALGKDAGSWSGRPALGVAIDADFATAIAGCDVLVDFSQPVATLTALECCVAAARPMVIGTTGFDAAQQARVAEAATKIPLCQAANYSIGVNVCLKLLDQAARALGPDYDVEIVEAHHRHKVDAPSGTALAMGRVVAAALGRDLERVAIHGREGRTGERDRQTIGFSSVRGGDVVGDHQVLFLGEGERIEIGHRASSRLNFARGALRAACWLEQRGPGAYDMRDVLDLR